MDSKQLLVNARRKKKGKLVTIIEGIIVIAVIAGVIQLFEMVKG